MSEPCSQNPELWFMGAPHDAIAKNLCNTACSSRDACLVVGRLEPFGIWGGMDPTERKRHRKRTQRLSYAAARKAVVA